MYRNEADGLKERIRALEETLEAERTLLEKKGRDLAVETALQKVSLRAISMRNSAELAETSAILFQQLQELSIDAIRSGVGIFDDANDAIELWLTSGSDSDEVLRVLDYYSLHVHPVFENIIPARKQNKPFSLTVLRGDEVRFYYQTMSTYLSPSRDQAYNPEEYFYSFFFQHGTLYLITREPLSEEECQIMIRFSQVFGLIYLRFLDLQVAESHTRKARQQAAVERVRAEIASMHSADDLNQITPMIWKEMVNMGVPFIRCGIFIVHEDTRHVNAYLSTPEGTSVALLDLAFDENDTIRHLVDHWRDQRIYIDHWDRAQFEAWVQSMLDKGQISDPGQLMGGAQPLESLRLQFIPFSQGMLYVGSREPLEEEPIEITRSLAESFSVAYARYVDFRQLEKAKNRLEKAYGDLKATQAQLIQSEKMASLGELTAGIAHEIQNPLNFVNNFSEVSVELLDEMGQELEEGNLSEALDIAADLKQNLEKITHHGKRADSIVKGMLQHSRSSDGNKEPTDINELAGEYLRLAYHGLRARDKSFSAAMETELDGAIGKADVVPQDIGRVLLNLLTNAFHAVNEKKRKAPGGYEPKVTVKTRRIPEGIEIEIVDNGDGIPDIVKDKIFQPFFTTKPTGQGTGLGLSLAYDIVTKGHGGRLKVDSREGEGTVFTVTLPDNQV